MALPEIIKDIDARVIRPTSTDNAIVRFNGTTGQIQNTANTIDDGNNINISGNLIPKTNSALDLGLSSYRFNNLYLASDIYINDSKVFLRNPWWIREQTHDADTAEPGITFAYASHNAPTTGLLLTFNCTSGASGSTNYPMQLIGQYNGHSLFYRHKNGDNGTWMPWKRILTDYDYTSVLNNTYLPLTGGTMIGGIVFTGSNGIQTRHIDGELKTFAGDLYLNYNVNAPIHVGKGGTYTISADGSYYSGKANTATTCDYPKGFTGCGSGGWGIQTGTSITDWSDGAGGDIDFRKNCPIAGQTSIKVDGRFYQNEGQYMCLDTNNFSGYALPLTGGTMSGWINFASIASWPTASGETYPINSNGLYWVGSSDWARIFYRVSASDTGNLVVQLGDDTNCNFIIENSAGTVYSTINNRGVSGAIWNDYAEYRESDITQPGRCIIENGDDTLRLSTERLQRGAEIVSDTFGFAIGETDTCKTPIAASGRVLAYGYEDREQFKSHIGYPVCSGPNGTVSIMTDEEEQLYPSRIIGYISAVPDYEIWGTGNVKVDGRIWIRIK